MRTVDVVIVADGCATGEKCAAEAAAVAALRRGRRVLIVLRSGYPCSARRLRSDLRKANAAAGQLWIVTNADVVCADGVEAVEAVVIRYARTGRLFAVNASALVSTTA